MDRYRKVARWRLAFGAAAGLVAAGLGSGCLHVRTDTDGKVSGVELKLKQTAGDTKPTPTDPTRTDGAVKPASASIPAAAPAFTLPSLPKLTGRADEPQKGMVSQVALGWHNRVSYLPDPTRNGAMGAGLVGQMFLFNPNFQFAPAAGKLTVEMFEDLAPGGTGAGSSPRLLGRWTFDREHLRKLLTADERFGKCYALFLPWPEYRPDISRVRLTARYDPDTGYPVFASPSTVTFDTSPVTGPATDPLNPPLSSFGLPAGGPSGPAVLPGLNAAPIPVGGSTAPPLAPTPGAVAPQQQAGPAPGGLPPIAFTLPAQR